MEVRHDREARDLRCPTSLSPLVGSSHGRPLAHIISIERPEEDGLGPLSRRAMRLAKLLEEAAVAVERQHDEVLSW